MSTISRARIGTVGIYQSCMVTAAISQPCMAISQPRTANARIIQSLMVVQATVMHGYLRCFAATHGKCTYFPAVQGGSTRKSTGCMGEC